MQFRFSTSLHRSMYNYQDDVSFLANATNLKQHYASLAPNFQRRQQPHYRYQTYYIRMCEDQARRYQSRKCLCFPPEIAFLHWNRIPPWLHTASKRLQCTKLTLVCVDFTVYSSVFEEKKRVYCFLQKKTKTKQDKPLNLWSVQWA